MRGNLYKRPEAAAGSGRVRAFQGIRGYGLLAVFLVHYFKPELFEHSIFLHPSQAFLVFGAIAVNVFFVLSGFLISGILENTRPFRGYFSVFYGRRLLRILPLYYVLLLVVALINGFSGATPGLAYWSRFLFVQYLVPRFFVLGAPFENETVHLWTLAIEMQFYLLWPLVVWFFPKRRSLIRITIGLLGLSFLFRLACPLWNVTPAEAYFMTPARMDSVLLGVLLSQIRNDRIFGILRSNAKHLVLLGTVIATVVVAAKGEQWASGYEVTQFLYPCGNLLAAAVFLAAMEENSFVAKACSMRWICWLGELSYASYLIHAAFCSWILEALVPQLMVYVRFSYAVVGTAIAAFCLTLVLALLSRHLIERPVEALRNRLRYGSLRGTGEAGTQEDPVLAESVS